MPALTQLQLLERLDPKYAISRSDFIKYITKRRNHFETMASLSATEGRYEFAYKWKVRAQTYDSLIHEISLMFDLDADPEREDKYTCPS